MPEIWDLYDGDGKLTGQKLVRGEEIPQGLYHIGVHIWPINHSGSCNGRFCHQRRGSADCGNAGTP